MYKGRMIMQVPNLPKGGEDQICWAGDKPEDEHGKTKLPRFTSRLSNCYLWIIRYELSSSYWRF